MSPAETLEYVSAGEWVSKPASTVSETLSTSRAPTNLTRREREVANLVAHGLTNRQIATELSISEHTVATHVSKIMRKLELSSRAQLAAWVADQQGAPSRDSK